MAALISIHVLGILKETSTQSARCLLLPAYIVHESNHGDRSVVRVHVPLHVKHNPKTLTLVNLCLNILRQPLTFTKDILHYSLKLVNFSVVYNRVRLVS